MRPYHLHCFINSFLHEVANKAWVFEKFIFELEVSYSFKITCTLLRQLISLEKNDVAISKMYCLISWSPLCVCVCVYVHPPWKFHLSGTAGTAREQINDVGLKKLDTSAGSLHLYFWMQNLTFQLAAFSCSYTRSGHSHNLTSIRLAFRT